MPHARSRVVTRAPEVEPAGAREGPFVTGAVLEGTYELRSVLGTGGMGQVLEAWDRNLLRTVAIKAPWAHVDPATLLAEAQALASIHHPGVAAVYAVGVHRGSPFAVLERIVGTSLEAHLQAQRERARPLEIDEILELLEALADALAAVHGAGIAHRDLKPENVMLARGGRVVLIDLGLMLPEVAVVGAASFTCGTPLYMAPEAIAGDIARGEAHLVDVYALGVLAYELLVGHPPFEATNTVRILRAHLATEPPEVLAARADAPQALAALVRAMLAKRPRDRPADMHEVLGELRAVRRDEQLGVGRGGGSRHPSA